MKNKRNLTVISVVAFTLACCPLVAHQALATSLTTARLLNLEEFQEPPLPRTSLSANSLPIGENAESRSGALFSSPSGYIGQMMGRDEGDQLGDSIVSSGDFVFITAPSADYEARGEAKQDRVGSVVVIRWNPAREEWGFSQELFGGPTFRSLDASFGAAIAVEGNTLVVGAPSANSVSHPWGGAVHVFKRFPNADPEWRHSQVLLPPDAHEGGLFGASVAIDGNRVVVGSPGVRGTGPSEGKAFLYERPNLGAIFSWSRTLEPSAPSEAGDMYGASVAIAGNRCVVAAIGRDGRARNGKTIRNAGSIYLFSADNGWVNTQELRATSARRGDRFGWTMRFYQNQLVVGSPLRRSRDSNGNLLSRRGEVAFFRQSSPNALWRPSRTITPPEGPSFDFFGFDIDFLRNSLVVANPSFGEPNAPSDPQDTPVPGDAVYFAQASTGAWVEDGRLSLSSNALDKIDGFGASVCFARNHLLVGAPAASKAGDTPQEALGSVSYFGPNALIQTLFSVPLMPVPLTLAVGSLLVLGLRRSFREISRIKQMKA